METAEKLELEPQLADAKECALAADNAKDMPNKADVARSNAEAMWTAAGHLANCAHELKWIRVALERSRSGG